MNIGRMRDQVTLQSPVDTQDSTSGQLVRTWQKEAKVKAEVFYPRGNEGLRGQQVSANKYPTVRIRYRSDVDETWQVTHDTKTLSVAAVLDKTGRKRELFIECGEPTV